MNPFRVLLWAAVPVVYAVILWSGALAGLGFELKYDSVIAPAVIVAFFFLLSRKPGAHVLPLLMLLMAALCGMVLSGIWASGVSDFSLLAGFFPLSDSFTYVDGAINLVRDGDLPSVASRRPLAPAVTGLLLFLCQGNFRAVLALLVFATALAMTLPVREMIRTHGWIAGGVMFIGLFFFYRRFIGTALTEHLGLTLGCLAFALLWRAAHGGRMPSAVAYAGLFVLTVALCARAAALFVLPVLSLWVGWASRGTARFSIRAFALSCAAIVAGFGLNTVVLRSIGTAGASSAGNFPYVLYGLVHGGDWQQALEDHPEIRELPELQRNKAIQDFAMAGLKERPLSLVQGAMRACGQMIFSREGAYSFVFSAFQRSVRAYPTPPDSGGVITWKRLQIGATYASFAAFSLLALAGLAFLLLRRAPASVLLLGCTVGILGSTPFAPPWASELVRAYAATMPLMLALPAIGLAGPLRRAMRGDIALPGVSCRGLTSLAFMAVPLVCMAPVLFGLRPSVSTHVPGGSSTEPRLLWIVPGSLVRLMPGDAAAPLRGDVDIAKARRNMGVLALSNNRRKDELQAALAAGDTLALGYDVKSRTTLHLAFNAADVAGWEHAPAWVEARPVLPGPEIIWWKIRSIKPPEAHERAEP